MPEVQHRAGPLKQKNKSHKTGHHRSKREIATQQKGKSDLKALSAAHRRHRHELSREERRNKAKQMQKTKREQAMAEKRGLGTSEKPPILLAVLPLSFEGFETPYVESFFNLILNCDEEATVRIQGPNGPWHVYLPRFKLRYEFIVPASNNLFAILDAVKVCDGLVFLHPAFLIQGKHVDADLKKYLEENEILKAIYSHRLPTTFHAMDGRLSESKLAKKQAEVRKCVQRAIEMEFPDEKLFVIDRDADAIRFLHQVGNQKQRKSAFKNIRSHVMAEKVEFVPKPDIQQGTSEEAMNSGTLKLYGFVRCRPLNVNSLVHIPGWGNFQMDAIEELLDPLVPTKKSKSKGEEMAVDELEIIRSLKPDPLVQESLEDENELDPMEGEQTWPTPEELMAAKEEQKKTVRRVPKGTSEYQAAWITDDVIDQKSDDDASGESESDDTCSQSDTSEEEMDEMYKPRDESEEEKSETQSEMEDTESIAVTEGQGTDNYDAKMDLEEEAVSRVRFREQRMDEMFPDEIDTPIDRPARIRFQKYRGLKNYHEAHWDPKENLPPEYARIFQFQNFNRARKVYTKIAESEETSSYVGAYVCVHLKNVPQELYKQFVEGGFGDHPLVLVALLPHEQKMTLMNVVLRKNASFSLPIKSKDRLILHVGYRRFSVCPVYSSHTNGNKFKYERFMRSDAAVVASFFAPITFPPCSVLAYKEFSDGSQSLVATGSVLNCNPDRVVVKRAVLSGHPYKINRRSVVVRYMFFNREDILWFKPVELRTKYGRKGHIKEPLGTHGHMKCVFDKPVKAEDTVLMNLYKRVFPKWTYDPEVQTPTSISNQMECQELDEDVDTDEET